MPCDFDLFLFLIFPSMCTVDTTIPIDGLERKRVQGFGFAQSQWLTCQLNDTIVKGEFESSSRVTCDIPTIEKPGRFSFSVSNAAPEILAPFSCSTENETVEIPPQFVPGEDVSVYEMSMVFDGDSDYVIAPSRADLGLPTSASFEASGGNGEFSGLTFGAWFYPTANESCKIEPIVCFTTKCTTVIPPPPPPLPPSPPPPSPPPPSHPPPFPPPVPSQAERRRHLTAFNSSDPFCSQVCRMA